MSAIERLDYTKVDLSKKNSFELSCSGENKNLRLAVTEPSEYGKNSPEEAQDLLRTVMLAHLIAPFMPKIIETNFAVSSTKFLEELYRHYGYRPPIIRKSNEQVTVEYSKTEETYANVEYASTHSGGLDSAYRLAKLKEGGAGVVGVHIRNLNPKGSYKEAIASQIQCKEWEIPYKQIKLLNSSGNFGFDTMRTRDFLLAMLTSLAVHPHTVKKIFVEGGMSHVADNTHFSEFQGAWDMFNLLLLENGINSTVEGIDPGDIETVGEVIELENKLNIQIIPLIQNCFSSPFQIPNNRRKWERETPNISQASSEHWCGSCLKCRRMTLGRIFYQDPRFSGISQAEIDYFKQDTYQWMKKYPHSADLITQSFFNHLESI